MIAYWDISDFFGMKESRIGSEFMARYHRSIAFRSLWQDVPSSDFWTVHLCRLWCRRLCDAPKCTRYLNSGTINNFWKGNNWFTSLAANFSLASEFSKVVAISALEFDHFFFIVQCGFFGALGFKRFFHFLFWWDWDFTSDHIWKKSQFPRHFWIAYLACKILEVGTLTWWKIDLAYQHKTLVDFR